MVDERPFADVDRLVIREWLAEHWRLEITNDMAHDAITLVCAENTEDHLADWLCRQQWDGEPRLNDWLSDFFGAPKNVYTMAVGRKWMVSAVARALSPGAKVDTMLVLEGPQGAGKSTGLSVLAGPKWYSDGIGSPGSKDTALALQGPWIVEVAELNSFKRAELTSIKHWLSQCEDTYRPPYGREVVVSPRRCVFAGTTNETHYLRDQTGNRRFWPVLCANAIDTEGLYDVRSQLWAEAVTAYKAGEQWHLDGAEAQLAAEEQAKRLEQDPWADKVADFLAGRPTEEVTLDDVYRALGFDGHSRIGPWDKRRVAECMQAAGWEQKRMLRDGERRRVWRKEATA